MHVRIAIFLWSILAATSASAGYVQNFVDAHRGCRGLDSALFWFETNLPEADGKLLGKKATDWTDEELQDYRRAYTACLRLNPGDVMTEMRLGEPLVPPPGAIEAKVDERMAEVMSRVIGPARASKREEQAALLARQALQDDKEKERVNAEREQASQQEAATIARRLHESSLQEERRAALQAQAKRDRDASSEAKLLAEREAPEIAAMEKEASEAHRARVAAEKRLEEVRQHVATAQGQLASEDAAANDAKAKRIQTEQQEAQRKLARQEYAALDKTCSVSAEQFGRIALGMSLRDVRQTFGCVGSLTRSDEIQGIGTFTVYQWDGAKTGAAVTTTFSDGRVVSKSQSALE